MVSIRNKHKVYIPKIKAISAHAKPTLQCIVGCKRTVQRRQYIAGSFSFLFLFRIYHSTANNDFYHTILSIIFDASSCRLYT